MILNEQIIKNKNEFIDYHNSLKQKGVEGFIFLATLKDLNTLDPFNLTNKLEANIPVQFTKSQCINHLDILQADNQSMIIIRRLIQIYLLGKSRVFQDPITINRIDKDRYVIHPGTTRLSFHSLWPKKLSLVFYYDCTGLPFDLNNKINMLGKRSFNDYPLNNYPFTMVEYKRTVDHKPDLPTIIAHEIHRIGWKEEIDKFIENKKLVISYDDDSKEIYFNKELVYCKNKNQQWVLNTTEGFVI